jgi:hypothetical protein
MAGYMCLSLLENTGDNGKSAALQGVDSRRKRSGPLDELMARRTAFGRALVFGVLVVPAYDVQQWLRRATTRAG